PRRAVGSVVGIGGMAGAMGGVTLAVAVGYILESTGGNYRLVFFIAGSAYLFALAIIHLLTPRLEPLDEINGSSVKPLSIGSQVGFGFVGLVFGTFFGWVFDLIFRVPGQVSSRYMVTGALVGALIGVVSSFVITNFISKPTSPKL
ncbi:MAG: hypothetical protein H0T92_17895, partial [Pyrinomonadaceae bacterium]|nr:hypothetical protein [Pyrinomonadaceae bacterium]